MSNYRRVLVPGACYFFIVVTAEREPLLIDNVELLRAAFRNVRKNHSFTLDAIVVLPEHLHCIWTLPKDVADYPMRWRLIKRYFSRELSELISLRSDRKLRLGERGIWRRRYWEHMIRDEQDYRQHVGYIH